MLDQSLKIGTVAGRAGVNVQTLRYYERRGLLNPERFPSGHRRYTDDSVRLVRFIKVAQSLGFSLDEIASLVTLRGRDCCSRSEVQQLAAGRLADIDHKLRRLRAVRKALAELVEACSRGDEDLTCPIIEALEDSASQPARRNGGP